MKKILCLVSALTLVLTSCSSDESSSENALDNVLPKEVSYIYSTAPEDTDQQTLVYNGNKLVSSSFAGSDKEVYTYTGDFITKIESLEEESKITSINEFTYEKGKLKVDLMTETSNGIKYISKTVYTYNADGTIAFVRYGVDPETKVEKKKSEGVLTYVNGNLTKSTDISETNSETDTYEYDTKNNPFKNVLGFNLLIGYDGNANNETKKTNVYKYGENTSTTVSTYAYEYNEKGYPIKSTESNSSKNQKTIVYKY